MHSISLFLYKLSVMRKVLHVSCGLLEDFGVEIFEGLEHSSLQEDQAILGLLDFPEEFVDLPDF